jgi:hypothetical protein
MLSFGQHRTGILYVSHHVHRGRLENSPDSARHETVNGLQSHEVHRVVSCRAPFGTRSETVRAFAVNGFEFCLASMRARAR